MNAPSAVLEPWARQILDTAHDAFISINASGGVVEWNASAERMFGWAREEVMGRELASLIVPEALRTAHRNGMLQYLTSGEATVLNQTIEVTAVHRDGRELPVELSISPLRTRTELFFNAFLRDLTDRKSADVRRRRLAAIEDTTSDALVLVTGDGLITRWNAAAERLFGWRAEEVVGRTFASLWPAEDDQARAELLAAMDSGVAIELSGVERSRKDGTRVRVDAHIAPLHEEDGRVGLTTIVIRACGGGAAVRAEWQVAVERVCSDPDAITIVLQPIVDLARGVIAGYEALARFAGPPDSPPDRWFAMATALGRADELEARAIAAALARRPDLPANCFLSLNTSPSALLSAPVQAVLAAETSLSGVVVEITEQTSVADYEELLRALVALRDKGALVAVDDAGAGYASLRHVLTVRPDIVKLDRSLCDGVDRDPAKAAAVELLGTFAGRLDAWIIAEGIERVEELDTLVRLGVPLAQGYLLSRPSSGFGDMSEVAAARLRRHQRRRDPHVVEALVERADGDRLDAMTVLPSTPIREAALRAMTRPEPVRFDPLVCCDEQGDRRGIVRVERLLEHLAADG